MAPCRQTGLFLTRVAASLIRAAGVISVPLCMLTGISLSGCATTSDTDSLRNDVASLRIESTNQKRELAQIKERVSDISRDVNTLTAIRESQSSLLTQSTDFSKELQVLKGRFDENKYFMDKTVKQLQSEKELQQARISSLENEVKDLRTKSAAQGDKNAPEASKESKPSTGEKPPEAAVHEEPQRLYDDGQISFKEKRYAEARKKFEKFMKDYPKHALVPNSYFWIGETYYAEKKYEDAILSYETLIKTYPNHDKARGAMLKQAYAFIELGDKKTGKVILERVLEKYPQSAEAELAQKKIAEIAPKVTPPAQKKKK